MDEVGRTVEELVAAQETNPFKILQMSMQVHMDLEQLRARYFSFYRHFGNQPDILCALNQAYRSLQNPVRRVDWIMKEKGIEISNEAILPGWLQELSLEILDENVEMEEKKAMIFSRYDATLQNIEQAFAQNNLEKLESERNILGYLQRLQDQVWSNRDEE